ncbi:hypothetical protein TNCV_3313731, partial [Trichonephila clavipes]
AVSDSDLKLNSPNSKRSSDSIRDPQILALAATEESSAVSTPLLLAVQAVTDATKFVPQTATEEQRLDVKNFSPRSH